MNITKLTIDNAPSGYSNTLEWRKITESDIENNTLMLFGVTPKFPELINIESRDIGSYAFVLKKEVTQIDWQWIIDSGIDCEFWDDYDKTNVCIGKLKFENEFTDMDGITWNRCRPRFDHWFFWDGNDLTTGVPLPPGFIIEIDSLYPKKQKLTNVKTNLLYELWKFAGGFRIIGVADNYKL